MKVEASESTPLVPVERASNGGKRKWWQSLWRRKRQQPEDSNGVGHNGSNSLPTLSERASFKDLSSSKPNRFSKQELNDLVEAFATEDKDEDKTWARLAVEKHFQNWRWYFPKGDGPDAPSLSKGWSFFEHFILPRYMYQTADHVFRLADPGETAPTTLFKPASMTEDSFIEFGLGVDQYFSTLKMLSVMFLVCFFISIPTMIYYASPEYSGEDGKKHLSWALRTSAICTRKAWVVCEDCTADQWGWAEVTRSFGTAPDGTVLVQRNECGGAQLMDGAIDYISFWFVTIFLVVLAIYSRARENRFDENRLTADDYSIVVHNPPPDAIDPDEWRDFFSQFADKQVTIVTVGLNNELLLKKLVERRFQMDKLRKLLPDYVDVEDEAMVRATLSRLVAERQNSYKGCWGKLFESVLRSTGMLIPAKTTEEAVRKLTNEIKELQKKKYTASNIFITFETEEGQRRALSTLCPDPQMLLTKKDSVLRFRGRVLRVARAADPTSIKWLDLSIPRSRTAVFMAVNLFITVIVIGIAAYLENNVRREFGPVYAGPLVSVFNALIPMVVEVLMYFERHRTEDSWQTSYYIKITLFRWVNTACIIKVFSPLVRNLDDDPNDVLPSMLAQLWSELIVTPLLLYLDIGGNIQRHILAPRALTQEEMNLLFMGTTYRLGERFTAMTNVLFYCFFYSAMLPVTFLFGAGILFLQYHTDKYCLLRIWRRSPAIGPNLARISRRYFFSIALVAFICSSAYAWAQFPFDNVCIKEGTQQFEVPLEQKEFNNVRLLDGSEINVTVTQQQPMYYCSQDVQDFDAIFPFPPTPRIQPNGYRWMTDEQQTVCTMFGWTAVAVIVTFLAYFMKEIRAYLLSYFHSTYEPEATKSQRIDFSSNQRMVSYIPQITLETLPYPLLACDVDGLDKTLIGWHDPKHSYDRHNLIFDVPFVGMPRSKRLSSVTVGKPTDSLHRSRELAQDDSTVEEGHPIFDIVKHYPTEWQRKLRVEREMVGTSLSESFDSHHGHEWIPLC